MQSVLKGNFKGLKLNNPFTLRTNNFPTYSRYQYPISSQRWKWNWATSVSRNPDLSLAIEECSNSIKNTLKDDKCNLCIVFASNFSSTKGIIELLEKSGFEKETIIGCTSNLFGVFNPNFSLNDSEKTNGSTEETNKLCDSNGINKNATSEPNNSFEEKSIHIPETINNNIDTSNAENNEYYKEKIVAHNSTLLSITAASLPECKIIPFHVENENLPDIPINWQSYQRSSKTSPSHTSNSASTSASSALILLINRHGFDEAKFLKLMESAMPSIPMIGAAFGSKTLQPERILAKTFLNQQDEVTTEDTNSSNTKNEEKTDGENIIEKSQTQIEENSDKEKEVLVNQTKETKVMKKSQLIDTTSFDYNLSLLKDNKEVQEEEEECEEKEEHQTLASIDAESLLEQEEMKCDIEVEELEEDDEDYQRVAILKKEMLFIGGKRYSKGAAGVLLEGPFRTKIINSSSLFPIDRPRVITGSSYNLTIDNIPALEYIDSLIDHQKQKLGLTESKDTNPEDKSNNTNKDIVEVPLASTDNTKKSDDKKKEKSTIIIDTTLPEVDEKEQEKEEEEEEEEDDESGINEFSFYVSVLKTKSGRVIEFPVPKPVFWNGDYLTSKLNDIEVGDTVQFYFYDHEMGMKNMLEKLKQEKIENKQVGSLLFSSNIGTDASSFLYQDDFYDDDDYLDEYDEDDDGVVDVEDDDDMVMEDDIDEDVPDDEDVDDDDDSLPYYDAKSDHFASEDTFAKSKEKSIEKEKDEDDSDDEFVYNDYDEEFVVKAYEDPESNLIHNSFPNLPISGMSSLCNIYSQPSSTTNQSTNCAYLSTSIILFEPTQS